MTGGHGFLRYVQVRVDRCSGIRSRPETRRCAVWGAREAVGVCAQRLTKVTKIRVARSLLPAEKDSYETLHLKLKAHLTEHIKQVHINTKMTIQNPYKVLIRFKNSRKSKYTSQSTLKYTEIHKIE